MKTLLIILSFLTILSADIVYVPDDYETIQEAIDEVPNEWTILVADGIYRENISYTNNDYDFYKSFTLMSMNGSTNCIIDGSGHDVVLYFRMGAEYKITIQGFTIQNGFNGDMGEPFGAGISIDHSNVTLKDLVVLNNISIHHGGGIFLHRTEETFLNNIILQNNIASFGAGIYIDEFFQSTILNKLVIKNNQSTGTNPGEFGGGVYIIGANDVTIQNSILSNNNSVNGGSGIMISQSNVNLINNTITNNSNQNFAAFIIDENSSVRINNTIYWGNTPNTIFAFNNGNNGISVDYSNFQGSEFEVIQGGWEEIHWGEGNINEDPLFVNPENNNYRLNFNSPCIDNGNPDLENDGADYLSDLDDQDPDGTQMDIGAYYFNQEHGDLNGDQSIDVNDVLMMVDYILGELDYADTSIPTADLNDDNIINIVDLLILVFNILLEETLPNQNYLPIYFSGVIEEMEDNQYRYSIDMLNENDVNALFLKIQFQDKLVVSLNKGDRLTEMDLDYRYFNDDTSVNILIYSISGQKIPTGLGSILELELVSSGELNRDGDLTDGDEFLDIGAANNFTELIPVEVVTSEEMGKLVEQKENIPFQFNAQLSPNPFNPELNIKLDIEKEGQYSIQIFDIKGQFVESVHNGYLSATTYQFKWNASKQPSGIYFVNIKSENAMTNNKVLLLK